MKLRDTPTQLAQHPPLRDWQQRCLTQALQQLSPSTPHFLCQATPGAGKMLMAAVLADQLLQRDEIDYVLYLGPSREVVSRAEETLADVTGFVMDSGLGARGGCYTYQSLRTRLRALQQLGSQFRVLLIWDESHHAGRLPGTQQGVNGANEWGRALLLLERYMRYTFALSGTPWRSDGRCLPLLSYLDIPPADGEECEQENCEVPFQQRLVPDFVYTLQEAVRDGVCRLPYIHLIDNRHIQLTLTHTNHKKPPKLKQFSSIPRLLRHPGVGYADLLRHDVPMQYVLAQGVAKLSALRQAQPTAGGLVVATDIEHAEEITEWMMDQGEDVCLVTSQTPNAHAKLRAFRESTQAWIVSVGMISEGVDIPRLRVCCYLSRIRTEQHFRQVLGRIIRRLGLHDPDCYLYVLNEELLRRYAHRIADDLPQENAVVTETAPASAPAAPGYGNTAPVAPQDNVTLAESETSNAETDAIAVVFGASATTTAAAAKAQPSWEHDMAFSQRFIEHLATLKI
ncbi:DEAD/DEAH box helicase family protein [Halomonas vilamensis]|uniref:DEAD/DEAH box helicase family protein n=1 Tax=Vreelandella vilamensis TaxID=531309 RepID=A0ABU1HA97_9GAMM|nr:DEAD/DEAH box helicase family protein [Halomonas vilamensis]MDR5900418.1 DEAD/DEAH box helicase family protein [Halomonas vilamensis]